MRAVIRQYSGKGASELFSLLEEHREELRPVMQAIQGFVSYTLARSDSGGFAITVCEDQAGIDESTRIAKEWVSQNAASTGAASPSVSVGDVILHVQQ